VNVDLERPVSNVRRPSSSTPSTLVGREGELLRLRRCLGKALAGRRQLILVAGEPGIGKTALVDTFCCGLGEWGELWIAYGQCFEHHGPREPYLPVLEALNRLCQEPEGGRLAALLGRRAPAWLAELPDMHAAAETSPSLRETL